jgi:peptidoglycan hydrolase-like protein with peptidoglycan-binding domain
VSTNKGTSVTALQDWLNIRPFDPRDHVKAFIGALRGVFEEDTVGAVAEPALIRPGVERC